MPPHRACPPGKHTHTHTREIPPPCDGTPTTGGAANHQQPPTDTLPEKPTLAAALLAEKGQTLRSQRLPPTSPPFPLSLSSCEHLTLTLPSLQTRTTRACSGTATPVPCLTNHFSTWALQSIPNWEGKHGALMLHELGDKGQFFPSIIPVLYKSYKRQEKPLQWGLFMNACGIWFVQNALFWVSTTSYCQQEKKFSNWSSNESIYLVTSVTNSLCSNHYFKSFHMLGSNNYLPSITSWGQ